MSSTGAGGFSQGFGDAFQRAFAQARENALRREQMDMQKDWRAQDVKFREDQARRDEQRRAEELRAQANQFAVTAAGQREERAARRLQSLEASRDRRDLAAQSEAGAYRRAELSAKTQKGIAEAKEEADVKRHGEILRSQRQTRDDARAERDAARSERETAQKTAIQTERASALRDRLFTVKDRLTQQMGSTGDKDEELMQMLLEFRLGSERAGAQKIAEFEASLAEMELQGFKVPDNISNRVRSALKSVVEGSTGALEAALDGDDEKTTVISELMARATEAIAATTDAYSSAGPESAEKLAKTLVELETVSAELASQSRGLGRVKGVLSSLLKNEGGGQGGQADARLGEQGVDDFARAQVLETDPAAQLKEANKGRGWYGWDWEAGKTFKLPWSKQVTMVKKKQEVVREKIDRLAESPDAAQSFYQDAVRYGWITPDEDIRDNATMVKALKMWLKGHVLGKAAQRKADASWPAKF